MAAYVQCTVTGDVVSPCFLRRGDAVAAAASSELLQLADWMAEKAGFPPRRGIRREVVRDLSWPHLFTIRRRLLEREFHTACARS